MTEKELEKLFKTKLEGQHYEYNPSAWKAMEKMLGPSGGRAGFFYWRSVAAILIFGLLVGGIVLWQPAPDTDSQNIGVRPEQEQSQQSLDETPPEKSAVPLETERDASTPTENIARENTSRKEDGNSDQPINDGRSNESADQGNIAASSDEGSGQSSENNKGSDIAMNPGPEQESTSADAPTEVKSEGDEATVDERENALEDWTKPGESNPILLSSKNIANIDAPNVSLGLFKTADRFEPEALPKFFDRHELHFNGGTVLNESYKNSQMGVGWHAGITYQYRITDQFLVSAGLNYNVINKVGISQQIDSVFYHFGSERVETEESGQRLDYLEMPVNFSWLINSRHQIGLGGYAARLVSVTEEEVKRHYSFSDEPEVERATHKGQNDKYQEYDFGLSLMYFYQLNPNLSLGLEMRRGLADITKDVSEVYEENHQNLNTRLTLRYRIL